MKKIKLAYIDFWGGFDKESFVFTRILKERYEIIFTDENPDFIICSNFGKRALNYQCPRILYSAEAKAPDFNIYDYAMGFDDIIFGDRYLRYPYYMTDTDTLNLALKKHTMPDEFFLSKDKFCCFVASNNLGSNARELYFDALCKYRKVDSGGRLKNNLPDGKPVEDKLVFQKQYKYAFAFENSSFPDYCTEKIIDAWAAGAIPLYWGDPKVADDFDTKAFIDCTKMKSPDELIERIKEIEAEPELYLQMQKTPILTEKSRVKEILSDDYLKCFLYKIFDQDACDAFRRNSKSTMWGWNHEHHMLQWSIMEEKKVFQYLRDITKKYRNRK